MPKENRTGRAEPAVTSCIALLLGALVSIAVMEAMITAFDLRLESAALVPWACVVAAAAAALACHWKWGGLCLAAAFLLWAAVLVRGETALEQLGGLVYRISYVYDLAYHIGYLQPVEGEWNAWAADWPLALWGAALACTTARYVVRGRGLSAPGILTFVPMAACFVVTDTVPEPLWLYAGMLGWGLLLLTALARAQSAAQGNRLTAMAALPAALALAALFLAVPREGYVSQVEDARTWIQAHLPQASTTLELPQSLTSHTAAQVQEAETVDLASLDGQPESDVPVLYVQAEVGGAVYLRGQDYDVYTGLGWEANGTRAEAFACAGESLGTVSVETVSQLERLYLPYYPQGGVSLVGGSVKNTALATTYSFQRQGLSEAMYAQAAGATLSQGREQYLALPEQTRAEAEALLAGILSGETSALRRAETIGAWLRSRASYDRQTPKMPEDEEDFAIWFLNRSDRGYCVHFSTAAVVLLRAAGVEARYVSGYMVRSQAGERTVVTGSNAHAWAEYYEPTLDTWLILEATPAQSDTAQTEQTSATEQAAPTADFTQPQTEPASTLGSTETQAAAPEVPVQAKPAPAWLQWVLRVLAALMLLEAQRAARRSLRRWLQRRGTPNAQALARWQEVLRLAKALGEEPPEPLEVLTGKAKFSQHTLSAEDLLRYETYFRAARSRLTKSALPRRLLARYLLAVI